MARQKGRKPDFRLKVFDKDTEESGEVGAGWRNDDGSISIRLNGWVVLSQRDLRNQLLTLFPEDGRGDGNKAEAKGQGPP